MLSYPCLRRCIFQNQARCKCSTVLSETEKIHYLICYGGVKIDTYLVAKVSILFCCVFSHSRCPKGPCVANSRFCIVNQLAYFASKMVQLAEWGPDAITNTEPKCGSRQERGTTCDIERADETVHARAPKEYSTFASCIDISRHTCFTESHNKCNLRKLLDILRFVAFRCICS